MFGNEGGVSTSVDNPFRSEMSPRIVRRGLSRTEGPLHSDRGLIYGLQQGVSNQSLGASLFASGQECATDLSIPIELTAADMSLSTLYLHELHHRQVNFFAQK